MKSQIRGGMVVNFSWYRPELNIKATLQEEKYDIISSYADQNSDYLMSLWNANEKEQLKKSISFGYGVFHRINRWIKTQSINIQSVFSLGMLWGTLKSLNHVLYCDLQTSAISSPHYQELRYISHLDEILCVLLAKGSLSHTDLSAQLKMKTSTLTEAMKKIIPYHLISISSAGKYKLYSLTDQGRRYIRYIHDQQNHPSISDSPDVFPHFDSSDINNPSFSNLIQESMIIKLSDSFNISRIEKGIPHRNSYTVNGFTVQPENSLVPKEVFAKKRNTYYSNSYSPTA